MTLKLSTPESSAPVAARGPEKTVFELASALVRLGGDVRNEVPRTDLTAPEIALLRAIHGGNDAVRAVKKTGERAVSVMQEKARLADIYGRRDAQAKILEQLFPGIRPLFPLTIAEVEEMATMDQQDAESSASDILN